MTRLFLLVLALVAAPAFAQNSLQMDAPRILHSADVPVKGLDGQPAVYTYTTTYDPIAGEYIRSVTDTRTGAMLKREVFRSTLDSPTEQEDAYARNVIEQDAEISGLISKAAHPVLVTGGFVLSREEGHACGPGSRCLQYDVLEKVPGATSAQRIRYVIVDMRTGSIVSRDFDPDLEGNLANPAMRRESRLHTSDQ